MIYLSFFYLLIAPPWPPFAIHQYIFQLISINRVILVDQHCGLLRICWFMTKNSQLILHYLDNRNEFILSLLGLYEKFLQLSIGPFWILELNNHLLVHDICNILDFLKPTMQSPIAGHGYAESPDLLYFGRSNAPHSLQPVHELLQPRWPERQRWDPCQRSELTFGQPP